MDRNEFSNGFDTLLNTYATAALHGEEAFRTEVALDEWEKSFFLTKAQEKVVIALYNGTNGKGESFETTEEMRRYLAPLVCECNCSKTSGGTFGGTMFKLTGPNDPKLWFIVYEKISGSDVEGDGCDSYYGNVNVYPVTHDEYSKIKNNPFRGPSDTRAIRLDVGDNEVEIVCDKPVGSYFIRYIKKPKPILLEDFPEDLKISDENISTEPVCELHEALHQTILDEAVKLAYVSKSLGKATTEKESK